MRKALLVLLVGAGAAAWRTSRSRAATGSDPSAGWTPAPTPAPVAAAPAAAPVAARPAAVAEPPAVAPDAPEAPTAPEAPDAPDAPTVPPGAPAAPVVSSTPSHLPDPTGIDVAVELLQERDRT